MGSSSTNRSENKKYLKPPSELRKKTSYFPLYWLVYKNPHILGSIIPYTTIYNLNNQGSMNLHHGNAAATPKYHERLGQNWSPPNPQFPGVMVPKNH